MWIFLCDSFLSIVDRGAPSGQTLLVRARRRGDIERVFPGAAVVENAGTDYAFRARIDREQVALTMAEQVSEIRYPNFKARRPCATTSGTKPTWTRGRRWCASRTARCAEVLLYATLEIKRRASAQCLAYRARR